MTDPWTLEKRLIDLRNCAYLMIATGNAFDSINPLAVISSRGLSDHVTVKRFKQIWESEQVRFDGETRERLARIPPNTKTGVEGK